MSDLYNDVTDILIEWDSERDPVPTDEIIAKVREDIKESLIMSEMFDGARNRERAKTIERVLAALRGCIRTGPWNKQMIYLADAEAAIKEAADELT